MTPDAPNIRHGYAIATWSKRLIAHLIDSAISLGAILAIVIGLVIEIANAVADSGEASFFARALTGDLAWLLISSIAGDWGRPLYLAGIIALIIYTLWWLVTLHPARVGVNP